MTLVVLEEEEEGEREVQTAATQERAEIRECHGCCWRQMPESESFIHGEDNVS